MKYKLILMSGMLLMNYSLMAQQEVISSGGNYDETSSGSLSWTIGETTTETVSDGTNTLTQGFQQSNLTVSEIKNSNLENVNIKLYPNPTTDLVILETNKITDLDFKIYSTNGKLLKTEKINNTETQIFFTEYSSGIYFLTISNTKKQIKTFQIIKK